MLALDSPRWAELEQAYGSAENIPDLLRELRPGEYEGPSSGPWFSLWSALAHQGDVYSASFAAVPHIVAMAALKPENAGHSFVFMPCWIEICRDEKKFAVPEDLALEYEAALDSLPEIAFRMLQHSNDRDVVLNALTAIAVGKRQSKLANVIMELSPDVVADFQGWLDSR